MHAVLITFDSTVPLADVAEPFGHYASALTAVDGLVMKTWLHDRATLGGFHLFEDEAAANRYLDGELWATVHGNPAFSNFRINRFDVVEQLSAVTGSPSGSLARQRAV
jgi:hypothetical protein